MKASPLTLNPVANGNSLPFVGPEPHSVAPLKPQSLRGEGNFKLFKLSTIIYYLLTIISKLFKLNLDYQLLYLSPQH